MFKTTIKNLMGHKVRVIITAIAIIAGVSFMAGTFVLTDTISAAFNQLFANSSKGTDAVVRQKAAFTLGSTGGGGGAVSGAQRDEISLSLLSTVRSASGVAAAEASIFVPNGAVPIKANNKPINPSTGAPSFGANWTTTASMNPFDLGPGGHAPQGLDQVVINKLTATRGKLVVGDSMRMAVTNGPVRTVKVVGIVTLAGSDSLGGASVVMMDTTSAAQLFGQPGKADSIQVHAQPGVSQETLVANLQKVLPTGDEAITGKAATKENEDSIQKAFDVFKIVLSVFAAISLVSGAFLIYNIFGIVVAQRTRELALLRALGASRKQVSRSVRLEALVTGLIASILGLFAGIGLAIGLTVLLKAVGLDVKASSVVVKPYTVVVSLVVGVLVTVVSASLPARRASRVPPMAALRDVAHDESGRSKSRLIGGGILLVLGALLMIGGVSSHAAPSIGVAALLLFFAIVVLGPRLAPTLVRGLGSWLPAVKGVTGQLARDNAIRSPKRTASTAISLVLALALISIITIFFSSATASFNAAVSEGFKGDLQLTAQGNGGGTLPAALTTKLQQVPQLQAVASLSVGAAALLGKGVLVWGTEGPALKQTLDIGVATGDLANLVGQNTIALDDGLSALFQRPVGSQITLGFPNGSTHTFQVVATYKQGDLIGQGLDAKLLLPRAAFAAFEPPQAQQSTRILVKRAAGVSVTQARAAVTQATQAFPTAQTQSLKEIQKAQTKQIDFALNFFVVLLALTVFIGFLGIAITLALSVIERTRELGLLRAIGMDRKRMKSMVRWEAVLIALLGTGLGLVLGCVGGAALASTFSTQIQTSRISFPITRLVVYAVLAALFGVLAAIYPARRAAKLNVLDAISSE